MKIVTWNCNMAFRKKAGFVLSYNPDIVIVPECEHPEKLKFNDDIPIPTDIFWYGTNLNKGLGVFSYSKYKFKLHELHNPDLKTILPLQVSDGQFEFMLFAIWANNPQDKDGQYIMQVWKAIEYYNHLIQHQKTILVGDFNSNTIWDKLPRKVNHSTVVEKLAEKNIFSVYHKFYGQEQGKEIVRKIRLITQVYEQIGTYIVILLKRH